MHLLNLDLATRFVSLCAEITIDVVEDRHGLLRYYFSENRVLIVQVGCFLQSDEELAAVGHWPCVSHTHYSRLVVSEFRMKVIFKGFPEDALPTCTCACWVSAL